MVTNMRCLAVLILFAIHSCFCDQVVTLNHNKQSTLSKLRTKKMDVFNSTKCNKIKCPTNEEPTCVKLTNKMGYGSKNIYIIAINKCEIEYVKCHKGLEAKVEPMKNCLQKHTVKSRNLAQKKRIKRNSYFATKAHHNNHPGSRRNRRKFVSSFNKPQKKINYSSLYFGAHNRRHSEFKEGDSNLDKSKDENYSVASNEDDNIQKNVIFQIRQIDNGDELENEGSFVGDAEFEAKSDDVEEMSLTNNKESQENEQGSGIGNVDETQNEEADDQKSDNEVPFIQSDENEQVSDNNNSNNGVKGQESNDQDNESVENGTEKNDDDSKERKIIENDELSQEENKVSSSELNKNNAMDEKKSNTPNKTTHQALYSDVSDVVYYDDVDTEQMNKTCPTICPVRDLMICGRTQNNLYSTFMSVCHLRKFNCQHPEQYMEVLSWQPCMLSAPYNFDLFQGRVREPNDEDVVLRYIRCRENENSDDPRCHIEK